MATPKKQIDAPITPRPYLMLVEDLKLNNVLFPDKVKKKTSYSKAKYVANSANDSTIPESGRNNTLTSLAGTMRRVGIPEAAIDAALQNVNQQACQPPLDPAEVSGIAKSVAKYAPSNPNNVLDTLTDTGNADRFANRWEKSVRYIVELHKWIIWEGNCWHEDSKHTVIEKAKVVARSIYNEGINIQDPSAQNLIAKHGNNSQQRNKIEAMVALAQSIPSLVVSVNDLDKKHDLLCVENGVIDLTTGKLRDGDPEDLITQQSSIQFDAKAQCPQFLAFLKRVMGGKMELVRFIQKVLGYSLTGLTSEQCLFFLYGSGANGKSTLLNVVSELLGADYVKQTPSETLMAKLGGRTATNDLARLRGARIVIANEVEGGAHLAESMIKQVTGGDPISARFLYGEFFEFKPNFKLFIAGNHKPMILGDDDGIWRRIHLIPFEVTIPNSERDPDLLAKLKAELPGILNFAIKGYVAWRKDGLSAPTIITDAVKEYRDEMDLLGQWIVESAVVSPKEKWSAMKAYENYHGWAIVNGLKPMSNAAFGRKLVEKFKKIRDASGNHYVGVGPKTGLSRTGVDIPMG